MTQHDYERIAREILQAVGQQQETYSAVDMVERLTTEGADTHTVQATMVDLIDRGEVRVTSELKLSTLPCS